MDPEFPDQVADAGVQHQHDDLGGSATSADGCCDDGGSGGSWARALLRRGWDLSRKAAIAGVAATAAPVVAPSLLVLSLAGVALSLPFAAYLASLAATDRLMGALLPPPRTQPCHACGLEDDGFLDESEAPGGEAPVFDHWRDTESDAIMEDNESSLSLPLSREPRFYEESVPSSIDVEDNMAEGEFLSRELGHESLVLDNREQEEEGTTMEDTGYITMEAPPRGFGVFGSAVLVLRDEDNMVQRMVEAPLTTKESVQELSVSGNEDRTEDGKSKDTEEMESLKEILSLGVDTTELSDLPVPVLGDEGTVVQRVVEAPLTAKESVQELSVSGNEDRTEDGKSKDTEEMESLKEILSLGVDTTELSDLPVPVLGDEGTVVQGGDDEIFSVPKSGQGSHLTDTVDKIEGHKIKEEIPLQEANVYKLSMLDDAMLERKIEGDVTVEMVVEEVSINTDPFTREVAAEQVGSIATTLPESESLQASKLVAQELQAEAMAEVANVDDIIDAALTEDIVLDIGDRSTEGMEHYGEGGVPSVISVVTVDDVVELVSNSVPAVSGTSDDMTSLKSRPDADRSNQTTGYTLSNKEKEFHEKGETRDMGVKTEENKTMDDKVPTRSMLPQISDVSISPVPDNKSKIEDEVTVEMVLEEVTSNTDNLVTREVIVTQLNIIASESESPSVSDHVAQELQAVNEAAVVDEIGGSTVIEDIKSEFSDRITEAVEHHSDKGSFVSGVPEVSVDDVKDQVSSRSTQHASARDSASGVEGTPVFENPHQTTGVEYKPVIEGFRRNAVAEDMDNYTEEQLREQLDTLRTITGYCPAPSLTLDAELVGLYIFVGVEPPVSSRDESSLNDLNTKLRFLKSIIGVE